MPRPTYQGWTLLITPRSAFMLSAKGYVGYASKMPADPAAHTGKQPRLGPVSGRNEDQVTAGLQCLVDLEENPIEKEFSGMKAAT